MSLPAYLPGPLIDDRVAPAETFLPLWSAAAPPPADPRQRERERLAEHQRALDDAYRKGFADATAGLEREHREELAQRETARDLAIADAERRFLAHQGAELARQLGEEIRRVEAEVEAAAVAAILPVLEAVMVRELARDAIAGFEHALSLSEIATVRLSGPPSLVSAAAEALAGRGVAAETKAADMAELTIAFDHTEIRTRLGHWRDATREAVA